MPTPITPITTSGITAVQTSVNAPVKGPGSGSDFATALSDAIGKMDQSNKATESTVDRYLSGESDEVHEVVMATQRNELQFELFLQMRNKVVQAYQEVMRMQM